MLWRLPVTSFYCNGMLQSHQQMVWQVGVNQHATHSSSSLPGALVGLSVLNRYGLWMPENVHKDIVIKLL